MIDDFKRDPPVDALLPDVLISENCTVGSFKFPIVVDPPSRDETTGLITIHYTTILNVAREGD